MFVEIFDRLYCQLTSTTVNYLNTSSTNLQNSFDHAHQKNKEKGTHRELSNGSVDEANTVEIEQKVGEFEEVVDDGRNFAQLVVSHIQHSESRAVL